MLIVKGGKKRPTVALNYLRVKLRRTKYLLLRMQITTNSFPVTVEADLLSDHTLYSLFIFITYNSFLSHSRHLFILFIHSRHSIVTITIPLAMVCRIK